MHMGVYYIVWIICESMSMICLAFSIWPFKCQVSAVIRALFYVNMHYGTAFSFSGIKDVHWTGLLYPVHPLRVCAQSRNSGNARVLWKEIQINWNHNWVEFYLMYWREITLHWMLSEMIRWFLLLPVPVTVCTQGWAIPMKIIYYCAISPLQRFKIWIWQCLQLG